MATKKRGSKLNKSETVQVRFDPKLKMVAELLAAKERRSLSSMIEWAVERIAREIPVATSKSDGSPLTAWQVVDECWDSEHYKRIKNLGDAYPGLLTYEERRLYELMVQVIIWCLDERLPKGRHWLMVKILWEDIVQCADESISENELLRLLKDVLTTDGDLFQLSTAADNAQCPVA